jgi:hypothetical protein
MLDLCFSLSQTADTTAERIGTVPLQRPVWRPHSPPTRIERALITTLGVTRAGRAREAIRVLEAIRSVELGPPGATSNRGAPNLQKNRYVHM